MKPITTMVTMPINKLFTRIHYLVIKTSYDKERYDTIMLYSITESDNFFKSTKEALDFVKEIDPRRYARIKKYLKIIVHYLHGKSCYMHKF